MGDVKFRKDPPDPLYVYPSIVIHGRKFDAEIVLSKKFGDANAMHCGRILSFMLMEDGEMLAYWGKREWHKQVPDMDAEAYVAALYFIGRYNENRDERIERSLTTHEHQC